MADFKVGDTAQLNSGGPVMTVTEISEENGIIKVFCTWFDDKGNQKYASFTPEVIEKFE